MTYFADRLILFTARMSGVDLALIMHKLNQNSIAYTKRYLGITDDDLQAIMWSSSIKILVG